MLIKITQRIDAVAVIVHIEDFFNHSIVAGNLIAQAVVIFLNVEYQVGSEVKNE